MSQNTISAITQQTKQKSVIERRRIMWFLALIDFVGALGIISLVHAFLPPAPTVHNYFNELWLLAFTLVWLITCDVDKNFRLSAYMTYIRVCKIAFWSAVGYLLFFVITRFFYSLTFLLWVTALWLIWGTATRWTLRRFLPPAKGLVFEVLPSILSANSCIHWKTAEAEMAYDIADFDFLLINQDKSYSPNVQTLLLQALTAGIPIFSLSQMTEYLTGKVPPESLYDFWTKLTFQIDLFYLRCKRLLDVLITLALSPLLILLVLIATVLIRISMGSPVFFWQIRIGRDNKPFKMVKFRTMIINAEKMGTAYTTEDDNRITRVGSLLRRLRLDELPQFYHVLKGDMSLIGPRPEETTLVESFTKNIPLYQIRHWLRPGITGWAQVMQGYTAGEQGMSEKLQYDMFYLKNISLWLDLIIIYKTIIIILTGFGSR